MQLSDVSTCGDYSKQYHFGFSFRETLFYNKYFFTTPLRKYPKDAVMIRGWGMLFGMFPSKNVAKKTIIESG